MTLGFKFQTLSETEEFELYCAIKCGHDCTVHRGRKYMRNIFFYLFIHHIQ